MLVLTAYKIYAVFNLIHIFSQQKNKSNFYEKCAEKKSRGGMKTVKQFSFRKKLYFFPNKKFII